jgi:hypothetical protein
MKKVIVLLVVFTTSFGFINAQNDSLTKSKIKNAMDEYVHWYKTTKTFKVGGDDIAVVGLLENIFFIPGLKDMYGQINPDITQLEINGYHPDDLLKTCSYEKWLNSIELLDRNNYDIKYRYNESKLADGHIKGTEYIIIYDLENGENRNITIHYYDKSLRSIFDTKRSLYK